MTSQPAHFPLLDYSPAIDAAAERFCLATDQIGAPRPQGGGCDIGAIESTTALPAPVVVPDICPLDDQIIAANTDTALGNCPAGDGADTITLLRDFTLREPLPPISSDITIDGAGYTISGAGKFRLFDVAGGTLALKNVTLTKGSASNGGAIRLQNGAQDQVENVNLIDNDAGWGGAIATASADVTLTVNFSSFSSNTSEKNGGAVYVDGGNVAISSSAFSGNSAKLSDGAIDGSAGNLEILNSTISGNMADTGAGIYLSGAEATLTHLTVVDNRARFVTGGVYMETGKARLRNSIVYGNGAAEDCLGHLDMSVGNFSGDGSCSSGARGNPNLGELVGAPARHPLYGDSPAIDAADASFCPAIDQVGAKRPIGERCDSGALTVVDATLRGNEAGWGGAIAMLGGRFTLYNSAFLDNSAENRGGGIWMECGYEVMADSVLRRSTAALGEREPGPMHDHFGSAIEWGGRAGGGCGDDVFASNVKVYDD